MQSQRYRLSVEDRTDYTVVCFTTHDCTAPMQAKRGLTDIRASCWNGSTDLLLNDIWSLFLPHVLHWQSIDCVSFAIRAFFLQENISKLQHIVCSLCHKIKLTIEISSCNFFASNARNAGSWFRDASKTKNKVSVSVLRKVLYTWLFIKKCNYATVESIVTWTDNYS